MFEPCQVMTDPELIKLEEEKSQLIQSLSDTLTKLKNRKPNECPSNMNLKRLAVEAEEHLDTITGDNNEQYDYKYLEMASRFTGILFTDVSKELVRDNLYRYYALVVSKALEFYLELTIFWKDKNIYEIHDITCHFINVDKCFLLETGSWIEKITKMKNFPLLMSVLSEYSEKCVLREKVLHKVERESYGTVKRCKDGEGGLLVHLHSSKNPKKAYLDLQWTIILSKRKFEVVHFFTINVTDKGGNFAKKNSALLQEFCAKPHTKSTLVEHWNTLLTAINVYEKEYKK